MMRKCPECGNTIKNSEICPICGKRIGMITSDDNHRPQIDTTLPRRNKKSNSKNNKNKKFKHNSDTNKQIFDFANQKTKNIGSITSSLLGILCIVGVMLIVVSGILAPDNNYTGGKKATVTVVNNNNSSSNQLSLQVKVIYGGHWKGSIGLNEDLTNYDDNGSKTVDYGEFFENDTLSASIQKTDPSDDELKVQFIKNGAVLKEDSTKTPYGIVTIAI